ncbi:hypothetical protein RT97_31405 [Variovorax paradoxus]|uniref:DUF4124 domain-containing protein n=1 Tax=Variovorax paradoxus TaxID=34073 RepID=A0A0D0JQN0_VARPD|nr:hypothetical protein [Variovorax paradoxus]KIQ16112.1 hypothetical protein RT97_31405 [Variovorax paradoxus]
MTTRRREKRVRKFGLAIFFIATCAYSNGVAAQDSAKTWRCGSTYSDRPCEGGKTVKVDDPRSHEDRRAAEAGAKSNSTQADKLERSRLSLEKAAYDRDRQAAREARSAAMAERRMALSEQQARERATKAAGDPRKSTMSFSSGGSGKSAGDAPAKQKKRKSRDSDAG